MLRALGRLYVAHGFLRAHNADGDMRSDCPCRACCRAGYARMRALVAKRHASFESRKPIAKLPAGALKSVQLAREDSQADDQRRADDGEREKHGDDVPTGRASCR